LKKQIKAQTSVEFVVLITFMLLVFTVTAYLIQTRTAEAQNTENMKYAKQMHNLILNEVTIAETMPYNYTKNFILPFYIDGDNYTVTINEGVELVINFRSKEYVYFFNKNFDVGSTIKPGNNVLTKKEITGKIVYQFN